MLDLNEQRLDFCKATMGVNHTVTLPGRRLGAGAAQGVDRRRACRPWSSTRPAAPSRCRNAFNYVAHTGKLVFVGITTDELKFAHPLMHRREMTLSPRGTRCRPTSTGSSSIIEEGRIDTRPWITHRTPFDELIGNFPSYTRPETGVIKAMVEVD